MIELDNGTLRVEITPDRGAEVRFLGRSDGGVNALATYDWRTPVPASATSTYGSTLLDWMSAYRGGWQELFPNAGLESEHDGVPLPFHGEVSANAWEVVELGQDWVVVRTAARLPLVLERRMMLAAETSALRIEEVAVNEGAREVPFVWAHHPAFVTHAGMVVDLPAGPATAGDGIETDEADIVPGATGTWPHLPARNSGVIDLSVVPEGPVQRLAYLHDRPQAWAALRDVERGSGVALAWDQVTFPHLWVFQQIETPGFPWYGRERLLALEPASYWPAYGLAHAIERGQEHRLGPGERRDTWITLALFDADEEPVTGVARDGAVTRGEGGT